MILSPALPHQEPPLPACNWVGVTTLAMEDLLIEVEAVAVKEAG